MEMDILYRTAPPHIPFNQGNPSTSDSINPSNPYGLINPDDLEVTNFIKIDGSMTINSCEGNDFIIWAEDINGDVPFEGTSKKLQLMVWNAWDTGGGRVDAWLNDAAMIVEVNGNIRRYKCNDSHTDENFDDIVFEVIINE